MTDKMADAVTRCIGTEHLKMAQVLQENVWSGGQNKKNKPTLECCTGFPDLLLSSSAFGKCE